MSFPYGSSCALHLGPSLHSYSANACLGCGLLGSQVPVEGKGALFGIGEGSLSSAFYLAWVWSGGEESISAPLQGGPFIIGPLCRLSCVTGLVRGRRNSSLSQGARISAWNLPKGLVSIGSLVLHIVYFQSAALALLSLVMPEPKGNDTVSWSSPLR